MLQHTQPEAQAITFVRKTIQIGPVAVDGFMLPNGEFRQGLGSTGRAIGQNHQRVSRVVSRILDGQGAPGVKALQGNESHAGRGQRTAGTAAGSNALQRKGSASVEALKTAGSEPIIKIVGRPESLLSLSFAQKVWSYEARHGDGASQDMAWQLIDTLAGVSLERSYQEAFGVEDSRSQKDRLLDFFIDWNIGPYRVLFDREFQIQFKRVTGHDINSKSQHVKFIIANFLYNRLPADVYEAIQELNPVGENGTRKYKHHQLLSDNAKRDVVVPIISSLKAFMVQAPSGDVRFVNEAMDKLHPTQRGRRQKTSAARYNQMSWC